MTDNDPAKSADVDLTPETSIEEEFEDKDIEDIEDPRIRQAAKEAREDDDAQDDDAADEHVQEVRLKDEPQDETSFEQDVSEQAAAGDAKAKAQQARDNRSKSPAEVHRELTSDGGPDADAAQETAGTPLSTPRDSDTPTDASAPQGGADAASAPVDDVATTRYDADEAASEAADDPMAGMDAPEDYDPLAVEDDVTADDIDFEDQDWNLGGEREDGLINFKGTYMQLSEPDDDASINLLERIQTLEAEERMRTIISTIVDKPDMTQAPAGSDVPRIEDMKPFERAALAGRCLEFVGLSDFEDF